jgi:hypothetical protein
MQTSARRAAVQIASLAPLSLGIPCFEARRFTLNEYLNYIGKDCRGLAAIEPITREFLSSFVSAISMEAKQKKRVLKLQKLFLEEVH